MKPGTQVTVVERCSGHDGTWGVKREYFANSMKIADLGPVIGVVSQDRATAIGGDMGAPLRELAVRLQLVNGADTPRHFNFLPAERADAIRRISP